MKRRQRPEQILQIAVMRYLDLVLPSDAIAFHCPNGGGRSKAEAGIFKAMGVKPGVPDIIIFWNGKTYCIELKADSNGCTYPQQGLHILLRAMGIPVLVARKLESVEAFLAVHEFPLRGKISGGRFVSSTDKSFPHQRAGRGE